MEMDHDQVMVQEWWMLYGHSGHGEESRNDGHGEGAESKYTGNGSGGNGNGYGRIINMDHMAANYY